MGLETNFFAITFPFDSFNVRRVEESKYNIWSLRDQYNEQYSFFRHGSYIYISPMTDDSLEIGEVVSLDVSRNPRVVSSLVKHIFFRTFIREYEEITPLNFYPFRFFSRKQVDDIAKTELPSHLQGVLQRRKMFEIQFRKRKSAESISHGAVINIHYRWIFDMHCAELAADNFDVTGLSVSTKEVMPSSENVLQPNENVIGYVESVSDGVAKVKTNDGVKKNFLTNIYLEKSFSNIEKYLGHKFGETKKDKILVNIRKKTNSKKNALKYRNEIVRFAQIINHFEYNNLDGFTFDIEQVPNNAQPRFKLRTPKYWFDYNPGQTHQYKKYGINKYGPYDSSDFIPKEIDVLVCCHSNSRGGFSSFTGDLINGIPDSDNFKEGLLGKYDLSGASVSIIEIDSYSVEEYRRTIKGWLREQPDLPDLAIVETRERFKKEKPENNPYYVVKAILLSAGIPVQFMKNKKTRKNSYISQFICDTIALQSYAKMGGTPWVLPADNDIDHEIVIGIGHSISQSSRFKGGSANRVVGITTFFTGDGRYILGLPTEKVAFDQYFDALLESLAQSIRRISRNYGWQSEDTVRIVLHVFKPLRDIEAKVVKQLADEFDEFKLQFCFVTIAEYQPFLLFDNDNDQGSRTRSGDMVGKYVPDRGETWKVDDNRALLQVKGPDSIKTKEHGFSNPILVKMHRMSSFTDLHYITQQVANFQELNWRSFTPSTKPVTIFFADLMAKQLTKLERISDWRPELVRSSLSDKKWFL